MRKDVGCPRPMRQRSRVTFADYHVTLPRPSRASLPRPTFYILLGPSLVRPLPAMACNTVLCRQVAQTASVSGRDGCLNAVTLHPEDQW